MPAEKLDGSMQLYNLAVALSWPIHLYDLVKFTVAINRRPGKHTRGFQRPQRIEVDAMESNEAPNDIAALLENFGISTVTGGGQFVPDQDVGVRWLVDLYVSSAQAWMADCQLRAHGMTVLSAPVVDPHRGSSAMAAARGRWKPSKRRRRPVTLNQSVRLWLRRSLLKR